MSDDIAKLHSQVDVFKQFIKQAFPERSDVHNIAFQGSYAQAWPTYARTLGISELELARHLAPLMSVQAAADLSVSNLDVLSILPFSLCQSLGVLPLRIEHRMLVIAAANPLDVSMQERVAFLANRTIAWLLVPPDALQDAILLAYSREATRQASSISDVFSDGSPSADNAIVKLGRGLLTNAVNERASDIHIQPYLGAMMVRIRVDGELRRLTILPDAVGATLVRHFKAICGMEPTNSITPQDGRMTLIIDGRDFDLRVSILPASRGERLVIRFLDQGRVHRLNKSGFSLAALQSIRRMITRPSGLILMTGPTGCGKTSTLYGMLSELNRSTVNIITVENPVEYRMAGISQVDVNDKSGRSFAAALRSILRQDPDIVLIGEIRDAETAEIAIQAAMTGHLVLSTLHTNDSVSAIPRLLGLGVQGSMLADSLLGVVAQRLCRTLCKVCKTEVQAPYHSDENLFYTITRRYPAHRPVGCEACGFTGYKGRLPIVDILEVNNTLRDAISHGVTRIAELDAMREGDLKSMAASAHYRIVSGETTINEAVNAMGDQFWLELAEYYGTTLNEEHFNSIRQSNTQELIVTLISNDPALIDSIDRTLADEGYKLLVANNADAMNDIVRKEEGVSLSVIDVPEGTTLDEALHLVGDATKKLYWTRLPSIVLLPIDLAEHETVFREHGLLSPCLFKPFEMHAFLSSVLRAQAR